MKESFKHQDRVLAIIVTYNAMKWLNRCISSMKSSTYPVDVFVVDNGSTDGTQKYIKDNYPECIFRQSGENLGFGRANNVGLRFALDGDYNYVYLLNQDAWILPDTISKLIELSKKYPDYGILSPVQMNSDCVHIDKQFLKNVMSYNGCPDYINDLYNGEEKDVYPVSDIMAAHWFVTRKCLERVGGFSPAFPHYGEDNNYSNRVIYHHFKIGFVPFLRVVHDRGERVESSEKTLYREYYIKMIRRLSDPLPNGVKPYRLSSFFIIYTCFKMSLTFKSVSPFKYCLYLLRDKRNILKYKAISINSVCAFLE